jgi:hypothetical protein
VEVAFRVKDSVAIGQTINIGFSVISGTTAGYLKNFTFTVSAFKSYLASIICLLIKI